MREHHVPAAGGRTLHVVGDGAPDGVPVVVHHGTPGAGILYAPWVADAAAKGLRLLTYDRPGYAQSSRSAGRSVADAADDVAAIADALGLDRILTWGISGGGPHALACAAGLGERVVAAASLAGVGPHGVEGLDFLAGMGEGNVEEFGLAQQGEDAVRPAHVEMAEVMVSVDVPAAVESMKPFLSDVDAGEMSGELGAYLLDCFKVGLASGVDGWVDDDLCFTRPWGFDVADIRRPVLVLQGREDLMVPYGHGVWLAKTIPGAEARLTEEDGHLTLITKRVPEVHAWLLDRWAEG